ncbi:HEAT repeat domain-containing protein [Portibacter marinus]|uniref:HEAT repeat domain-containing protein n=1 Tax=Portibacter marinus TaxID=2898660 RepID=UPI001F1E23CB|nr:HEAT repeat domain-containing protein [Portibacter marinus]
MENSRDCAHAKEQLLEEIQEGLSENGFDLFIEKHIACREELISMYNTLRQLDQLEMVEPSSDMDQGFYAKLAAEPKQKLKLRRSTIWFRNIAVAASIFMVGALIGFYLLDRGDHEMMMVEDDLLNQENIVLTSNSSMSRLEDISEMKNAPKLDKKIIEALNRALLNDPNVNVRLSAIEAMLHYADNPKVRENLIKAIPYQTSPIIQMTLAEVMISLDESESKDEWLQLFRSDRLEDGFKEQLEEALAPVMKL